MANKSAVCPACGGTGIHIVYGYAPITVGEAASRGEIVLGVCEVTGVDPNHECRVCGVRWMVGDPVRWTPASSAEDGYRPG